MTFLHLDSDCQLMGKSKSDLKAV